MSLNFKYKPTGKQVIPENIRITCEYCGRTIDTATDDHCPSCGAVYDANAHLQEHKRRQEELGERIDPDVYPAELQKVWILRKFVHDMDEVEAAEFLIEHLSSTKTNEEFFDLMKSGKL